MDADEYRIAKARTFLRSPGSNSDRADSLNNINSGCAGMTSEDTALPCPDFCRFATAIDRRDTALPCPDFA